jgi:hypothetical protein
MYEKQPFSVLEWNLTPDAVRRYILLLEQNTTHEHAKRIEKLEVQTRKNFRNSSKPP